MLNPCGFKKWVFLLLNLFSVLDINTHAINLQTVDIISCRQNSSKRRLEEAPFVSLPIFFKVYLWYL